MGYSGFIIGHHFYDVLKRLICSNSVIFIIDFMKTLWIRDEFEMDAFIMSFFFFFYMFSVLKKKVEQWWSSASHHGLPVRRLCVWVHLRASCVFFGCSYWLLSRLPPTRPVGNSKLSVGVRVSVTGCWWPCNEPLTCPRCNPPSPSASWNRLGDPAMR